MERREEKERRKGKDNVEAQRTLMIEQEFVFLAVSGVDPANGLRADMQINSDVHCHLRLLSKPLPNDSG